MRATGSSRMLLIISKSPPAENALPAPVTITALISGSSLMSRQTLVSCVCISASTELYVSGRSNVTLNTRSEGWSIFSLEYLAYLSDIGKAPVDGTRRADLHSFYELEFEFCRRKYRDCLEASRSQAYGRRLRKHFGRPEVVGTDRNEAFYS